MASLLTYLVQLALVLGVMLGFYALLRPSLRDLLEDTLRLPAGTTFYLRALLLLIAFVALGEMLTPSALEDDVPFMQAVLDVGKNLERIMDKFTWIFVVYLVQITVVTGVLRRRNEQ